MKAIRAMKPLIECRGENHHSTSPLPVLGAELMQRLEVAGVPGAAATRLVAGGGWLVDHDGCVGCVMIIMYAVGKNSRH